MLCPFGVAEAFICILALFLNARRKKGETFFDEQL